MFEEAVDFFANLHLIESTPLLEKPKHYYLNIDPSKLDLAIQDQISFSFYKTKLIEFEAYLSKLEFKNLENTTDDGQKHIYLKNLLASLFFMKIFCRFLFKNKKILIEKEVPVPKFCFNLILRTDIEVIKILQQEYDEVIFHINLRILEGNFYGDYNAAFYIIDQIYKNDLEPQNLKYLLVICGFFYLNSSEEERTSIINEFLMNLQEKSDAFQKFVLIDSDKKIHFLSYFLLIIFQLEIFYHDYENTTLDANIVQEMTEKTTKKMKNMIFLLFQKCQENVKLIPKIGKFIKLFIENCEEAFFNEELASSQSFFSSCMATLAETFVRMKDRNKSIENSYKLFILDTLRIVLKFTDKHQQISQSYLNGIQDALKSYVEFEKSERSASKSKKSSEKSTGATSTGRNKKRNSKKTTELSVSCQKCKIELEESISVLNYVLTEENETSIEKYQNCIFCFLRNLSDPTRLGRKKELQLLKMDDLFNDPFNSAFTKILIQIYDSKVLESKALHLSSRKYFLCNLLTEFGKIKPKNNPISTIVIENLNAHHFSRNADLCLPNPSLIEFIKVSMMFTLECNTMLETLKNALIILSNENVTLRTKVLDILQSLIQANPNLMDNPQFLQIIENRIMDTSPTVRLAALSIIMKYLEFTYNERFFMILIERLNDIEIQIRKKLIIFLAEKYSTFKNEDSTTFKKILKAFAFKVYDIEEISETALNFLEEILFGVPVVQPKKRGKAKSTKAIDLNENVILIKDLCLELSNNQWFQKLISKTAHTSNEKLIGQVLNCLIEQLLTKNSQDTNTYLILILGIARFYPQIVFEEMKMMGSFLKFLYELKTHNTTSADIQIRKINLLSLVEIFETTIDHYSELEEEPLKNNKTKLIMTDVQNYLMKLIHEEFLEILHAALKLLIKVIEFSTQDFPLIKNLFVQMYAYVIKKKSSVSQNDGEVIQIEELSNFEVQSLMRSLYILTYITRYFDISEFLESNFSEEEVLKTIYYELILFSKSKNNLIEETCVECLMILWEKKADLVYEIEEHLEKYLVDQSLEKKSLVNRIYKFFILLLEKHEDKIKAHHDLTKEINKKNKGKNLLKKSASISKMELKIEGLKLETNDYEKISHCIKDLAKRTFINHIFDKDSETRRTTLYLMKTLCEQGFIPYFETNEFFMALLCDPDEDVRKLINESFEREWRHNRTNITTGIVKGCLIGLKYLQSTRGSSLCCYLNNDDGKYYSYYDKLNEIMKIDNDDLRQWFIVFLLRESFNSSHINNSKELSIFICSILLSTHNYDLIEFNDIYNKIFNYINDKYYKIIKTLKTISKDNTFEGDPKPIILESLILMIHLITLNLIVINSSIFTKGKVSFEHSNFQTLLDYLERKVYKQESSNTNAPIELNIESDLINEYIQFIDFSTNINDFLADKEKIYLLYKKIKLMFSCNIITDPSFILSLENDFIEAYDRMFQIIKSKRKSNSKSKTKYAMSEKIEKTKRVTSKIVKTENNNNKKKLKPRKLSKNKNNQKKEDDEMFKQNENLEDNRYRTRLREKPRKKYIEDEENKEENE